MASGGQAPGGQAEEGSWWQAYFREKNTFLEPISEPDGGQGGGGQLRRQHSEPNLSSASSNDEQTSSSSRLPSWGNPGRPSIPPEVAAQHLVFASSENSSRSQADSRYKEGDEDKRGNLMDWPDAVPQGGAASSSRAGGQSPSPGYLPDRGSDEDTSDQDDAGADRERAQQIFAALSDQELSELKAKVPLDDKGRLTSLGSIGHASGNCVPCAFAGASYGCPEGLFCGSCHFPHAKQKGAGAKGPRPCKGKRDRYRKLVNRVMTQIDQDPDSFDPSAVNMPPSIAANEALKDKFLARMKNHVELVKSAGGGGGPAAGGASSSSAARSAPPAPGPMPKLPYPTKMSL